MDKLSAIILIKDTLQNSFNKEQFLYFIKNLLNHVEETPTTIYRGNLIPDAYKSYIQMLERICKYRDPKGNKIDVLIIHLKKETSLEQARTMQRNFIALYLNGSRGGVLKDAAIVAFVSPDKEDWRFSFVKMEYKLTETPKGTIKAREEFTPAKRYSFLVGKNENSHTAQSRLVPLLLDDEHNPSLKEIEDAFSIEKVTKEFFEKYRELFLRTKDALDEIVEKDIKIKDDFTKKGVDTVDFVKKLLGQIVFLYFLQKKGWFGVERDADWGTGPKNFLRILSEKKIADYKNFFNDILEPLFYEALASERTDDFYSRFNCKIPFLNGGLFDPINNYDWVHTDILLLNELFSNEIKTKEGDIGTGILDVFDCYNFTVKEDEPLEKEVAVDPEMLGKVFENLLEVKDRKSKGTYYTPREIVHYMCQESLINYLDVTINSGKEYIVLPKAVQKKLIGDDDPEQLGMIEQKTIIPRENIESFIKYGVSAIEHDKRIESKGYETRDYSYKMPESIRLNARLFDDALKSVKICDPAIGSGAFPVAMMHEIVRARETLTTYLPALEKANINYPPLTKGGEGGFYDRERTPYHFKRHAIQNCLYGVDIDPGAVDIAKLRLWLSLVVDEDDFKTIKPLPNLDYKIVCGDSLSSVNILFHHAQLQGLERLKEKYFEETNPRKKIQFKEDVDNLISEITNNDKHFDFKVYFSEVFHQNGGFDITIGNPPYVRADSGEQHLALRKEIIASKQYETLWEKWDLYVPFIERGYKLLKPGGITTMIVSDAYCHSKYAQKSQNWFLQNSRILRLDFLSKIKVFEAGVHNIVYFFQKADGVSNMPERRGHENEFGKVRILPTDAQQNLSYRAFSPTDSDNNSYSKSTVALEDICWISYGLTPSSDEHEAKGEFTTADLVSETRDKIHYKPYVDGKHLDIWLPVTNLWLEWGTTRAPAQFRRPTFPQMYEVDEKILAQRSPGTDPKACYDNQYLIFTPSSVGFILWHNLSGVHNNSLKKRARYRSEKPPRPDLPKREELEKTSRRFAVKYLLAVMNSSVARDFLRTNRRSNIHLYPDDWKKLPIPDVPTDKQAFIVKLVDQILVAKQKDPHADISVIEKQIDEMVYDLYGLTPEEIEIVEGTQ